MVFHQPPSVLAADDNRHDDAELPSAPSPSRPVSTNTDKTSTTMTAASEAVIRIVEEDVVIGAGDVDDVDDDDESYDVEDDLPPEPLKGDHSRRSNNDRHIFMTLYIIMFLALGGLAFATTRYVQARKASNGGDATPPNDEIPFNRDTTAFKIQLQSVLSEVVRSSVLLEASSPQAQAIEWLVFEDRTLTMEDLTMEANGGDPFKVYQRYALMALFFATNGELWEEMPWTDNILVPTCSFEGVDCDEKDQVVVLDLFLRKLRGRVPEDLGLLTQLTGIRLNSNLLEGDIPSVFFDKLTNLESLDLSRNEFSSTLSPSISKLTNLEYLFLDQVTELKGTLPESLKTLSNLKILRLEQSQMEGPIFEFVPHWPKLVTLDISQSLFTGTIPSSVGDWEKLSYLFMINSSINATNLPSEIGLLSNLVEFEVWSTTADGGTIPTELGDCKNLETLSIQGSNYIGEIPSELGQLTKLQGLILEGSLTGTVPSELGLLTNLNRLSLALNKIVGQLPEELGNLKELAKLEVHYTDLTGSIPSGVCSDFIDISRSCPITECECCRNPCHKN